MSNLARRFRENASGVVSVLVTGIWLAALLTEQEWWLPFMLFGYIALVPLVAMLIEEDEEERDRQRETSSGREDESGTWGDDRGRETGETAEDALQTLRDRYARGELTDEQFERKLERLLETETLEDAEDRIRRSRSGSSDRELETETEFER